MRPDQDGTAGAADEGGDPVCWLSRVCPECGLFLGNDARAVCERCGAPVPATGEGEAW